METHEFDLRDYDLVVSDGRVVLTRRPVSGRYEDGEFLVEASGAVYIHWAEGSSDVGYGSYVWCNMRRYDTIGYELIIGKQHTITGSARRATAAERRALLCELERNGYRWHPDIRECFMTRWRAERGEKYQSYVLSGELVENIEEGSDDDEKAYRSGNYFPMADVVPGESGGKNRED